MNLVATIERAQRDALLTWRGHLVAPWLFEGYRKFAIQPSDDRRARVTHVEDIHGLTRTSLRHRHGGASCEKSPCSQSSPSDARREFGVDTGLPGRVAGS